MFIGNSNLTSVQYFYLISLTMHNIHTIIHPLTHAHMHPHILIHIPHTLACYLNCMFSLIAYYNINGYQKPSNKKKTA